MIYEKYDDSIVQKIFQRQVAMMEKNEENIKENKKSIDPRLLLILDNVFDPYNLKKTYYKNKYINELYFNSRCYGITVITINDNEIPISPKFRQNFDYIFLHKDANSKYYINEIKDKPKDNEYIVIDNKTCDENDNSSIFSFNTEPIPSFKFQSATC